MFDLSLLILWFAFLCTLILSLAFVRAYFTVGFKGRLVTLVLNLIIADGLGALSVIITNIYLSESNLDPAAEIDDGKHDGDYYTDVCRVGHPFTIYFFVLRLYGR